MLWVSLIKLVKLIVVNAFCNNVHVFLLDGHSPVWFATTMRKKKYICQIGLSVNFFLPVLGSVSQPVRNVVSADLTTGDPDNWLANY